MMTPMVMGLPGGPEVLILIVVALALLVFGGSRLAGIGKGTGKAIREFKEETQSLRGSKDERPAAAAPLDPTHPTTTREGVVEAEVVEPRTEPRRDV